MLNCVEKLCGIAITSSSEHYPYRPSLNHIIVDICRAHDYRIIESIGILITTFQSSTQYVVQLSQWSITTA